MKSLQEILALLRYANACAAIRYTLWHLEHSRLALDKAYTAAYRARADLRALEIEGNTEPEVPVYLQGKDNG